MQITEDMTIGEVIKQYPQTAEVLLNKGVHCVGCHARAFETLGQGLRGHGMTDEQVGQVIKEMNAAAEKEFKVKIEVTDAAAEKLKSILDEEKKPQAALRLMAEHGEFALEIDEQKDDDIIVEEKGLKLLVSPEHAFIANGSKIDYDGRFVISKS